jgi:hypothetical protein
MTIDDRYSQLPEVLQNVADIMSNAQQQVTNEQRTDEMNELIDTVAYERRQLHVWERLMAASDAVTIELSAGTQMKCLVCQHACDEWVVTSDESFRFVIPTENIRSISGLGSRAVYREHHGSSCGLHVISQLSEQSSEITIIFTSGERVPCEVIGVWRDCIDIRVLHAVKTVPFRSMDCVQIRI